MNQREIILTRNYLPFFSVGATLIGTKLLSMERILSCKSSTPWRSHLSMKKANIMHIKLSPLIWVDRLEGELLVSWESKYYAHRVVSLINLVADCCHTSLKVPKSRRQNLHLLNIQKEFSPSNITLRIIKLESKQGRSRWEGQRADNKIYICWISKKI